METTIFRLASGLCLLAAGGASLLATPVVTIDQSAMCRLGRSGDSCSLNAFLTGSSGAALPASLAAIELVGILTGEQFAPANTLPGVDLTETYAVMVVSPAMITSIQLSFDPRLDSGAPAFRALETVAGSARKSDAAPVRFDSRQVELTLGAVMSSIKAEKSIGVRAFGKADYMNFALVSQLHNTRPNSEPETDEISSEDVSPR